MKPESTTRAGAGRSQPWTPCRREIARRQRSSMKRLLTLQLLWDGEADSGGNCMAWPNGTKLVANGCRTATGRVVLVPIGGTLIDKISSSAQACLQSH
jgi:hypothetical protein